MLKPNSDWEKAVEGKKELDTAKSYSMYDVFSEQDVIWQDFGHGVVTFNRTTRSKCSFHQATKSGPDQVI